MVFCVLKEFFRTEEFGNPVRMGFRRHLLNL